MSSLRDVAARAGVSVATASRVANGGLHVRPETRARVEQAMRELLYVPMRRKPVTGLIGVLVPELENPIFSALAQAIETRAAPRGLASILCNTRGGAFREVDYVHMLLDRGVEGMVFVSCETASRGEDHSHYRRLIDEGARIVFVNGTIEGLDVPAVGVDERAAAELATRHLLELGHRRIGFAAGPAPYSSTREKAAGWVTALRAEDIDCESLVVHADLDPEGGAVALAQLLELPDPPTAVICSNDMMASGALHEAVRCRLRVPDDLSVVGCDGVASAWTQPRLTTVEQPVAEIAETAVAALRRLIRDPHRPLPYSVYRPKLRAGETTAPPTRRRTPGARVSRRSR